MKKNLLLLVVSAICLTANARNDSIRGTRIYPGISVQGNSPEIDGILDDKAWQMAEWQTDFTQHTPYSGKQPSFQSRFALCFDEDYIYVAYESFDPQPDSIVTRLTRRDDLDGDMIFVDFDSYHDLRTCFSFLLNAGGVKSDFILSENGNHEDFTWDPVWWAKTSITGNSWIAEIKIPFSQLRFDNSGDGIWGMNVGRLLYRKNELSMWQHIPVESPGMIHLFGELHGLKDIEPRKQAEVIPFATAGVKKYNADPENPFQRGMDRIFNGGVDAKVGVTNNLTLDVSVNPDFGQVEADPSEVNLTAYESFFEEKRPLFIEGKNIYNFPLRFGDGGMGAENLFYSRRIGRTPHYYPEEITGEYVNQPEQTNILAAAKLSGKTRQGTSIGVLETVSSEEFAVIDRDGERRKIAVEPLTNYFVGRVVQDLNMGNTVAGGMVTSTYRNITTDHLRFLPTSATTGGFNIQQFWGNKAYNIKLVNYFSSVNGSEEAITTLQEAPARFYQRPGADYVNYDTTRTNLSGYGGNLQFWKTSGKFNFLAAFIWKSPGLELNDIGYMRQSDELFQVLWLGYNLYEPFSIFRSLHITAEQFRIWDFGGALALGGLEAGSHASFKNFWSANIHFNITSDKRINSFLRGGPSMLLPGDFNLGASFSTDERKKLVIEPGFSYELGFENSSTNFGYSLEMTYRPNNSLNVSLEPEYSSETKMLQYVSHCESATNDRYVFATIDQSILALSIRMNLTLSPNLTFQFWGQPFIATGNYSNFKYISNPEAAIFTDRFHEYTRNEISYNNLSEIYTIQEEPGTIPPYTIENPNFSIKEFLSNLVIRWEYQPGSIIYLVWSQSRDQYDCNGTFQLTRDLQDMVQIRPTNVFLVKFSYRIGR